MRIKWLSRSHWIWGGSKIPFLDQRISNCCSFKCHLFWGASFAYWTPAFWNMSLTSVAWEGFPKQRFPMYHSSTHIFSFLLCKYNQLSPGEQIPTHLQQIIVLSFTLPLPVIAASSWPLFCEPLENNGYFSSSLFPRVQQSQQHPGSARSNFAEQMKI